MGQPSDHHRPVAVQTLGKAGDFWQPTRMSHLLPLRQPPAFPSADKLAKGLHHIVEGLYIRMGRTQILDETLLADRKLCLRLNQQPFHLTHRQITVN